MTDKLVQSLATNVAGRLKAARDSILEQMIGLGLTPERGWRISEELRHTVDGTEWTFRPIHMREHPPSGLETSVRIDHDGRLI